MSRKRRKARIRVVETPEARRTTQGDFRGSTLDFDGSPDINLGGILSCETWDTKEFIEQYATVDAEMSTIKNGYPRKAYRISQKVIQCDNLVFDMTKLYGESAKDTGILVFSNCRFVNPDDSIRIRFNGHGIVFENCTFELAYHMELELLPDSAVRFDYCYMDAELRVNGTIYNRIDINYSYRMRKVNISNVDEVNVNYEIPFSLHVERAIALSMKSVSDTYPSSPDLCIYQVYDRLSLEKCDILRPILVKRSSLDSICMTGSKLNLVKLEKTVVKTYIQCDSTVAVLFGLYSIIRTVGATTSVPVYVSVIKSVGFPTCEMTLYKKVKLYVNPILPWNGQEPREVILRLKVPAAARRYYSTSQHKFRVDSAIVEEVLERSSTDGPAFVPAKLPRFRKYALKSLYDPSFIYEKGKTVYPKEPFAEMNEACASGIHGFTDIEDAAAYSG